MLVHYQQYIPLVIAFVLVSGVVGGLLILNAFLGPKRRTSAKGAPFECGNQPSGDSRHRFSVKFYLVGIFFILFDIEAVFLFPWAVNFRGFLNDAVWAAVTFVEIFLFVGILALGLVYVWKKGALEWE